ncbi:PAS domain-containing protein [Rhodocytophaga aerolata]
MLFSYSIIQIRKNAVASAKENAMAMARDYSGRLKATIETPLSSSRSLSNSLLAIKDEELQSSLTRDDVNGMLKNYLQSHTSLLGTYTLWEPNAFDGKDSLYINSLGHDHTGRFIPYWVRVNGKISLEPLVDYETAGTGNYYLIPKKTAQESVLDPYIYPIGGKQVLMMSVVVPIIKNGQFLGITGSDISIDWIQDMVDADQKQIFGGLGQLYVLSTNGTIAAATGKRQLLGKKVEAALPHLQNLQSQPSMVSNDTLRVYAPINFGHSTATWQVCISVPLAELTKHAQAQMVNLIWLSITFLAGFIVFVIWLLKKQLNPIYQISSIAMEVAQGNLAITEVQANNREIEELNAAFFKVVESQREITGVCTAIARGDFSKRAVVKSEKDELSKAVNQMIDNLKTSAEEDAKRSWANEGLAKFGEILRSDKELNLLAESVLANLVKYTGANQGAFFLVNESASKQVQLEMIACYAYNRKKFISKKIEVGEGLVGQCYLEKDSIYLTDIPQNYVQITSGLGEATPSSVLLVPLLNNGQMEGVIELASFKPFKDYEIAFIKKIAESIASTISTVRVNEQTKTLLEKSQQQAEELRAQEEEMRQNMEELNATQEEMTRKQIELGGQIAALNNAAIVSEVDLRGNIIFANDEFCRLAKYTREELIGKKQSIVRHPDMPAALFDDLWATIVKGKVWKGEVKNRAKDGSYYWVDATITPVLGENGRPIKYIGVRYDITSKKEQEERITFAIKEAQEKAGLTTEKWTKS